LTSTEAFLDLIAHTVLKALAFAHERNRDIKPDSVLVTEGGVPKVADFGISKIKTSLAESEHALANHTSQRLRPTRVRIKIELLAGLVPEFVRNRRPQRLPNGHG
jgi:serine/threonine protein kinase